MVYSDQEGMGTLVMPTVVVLIKGGPHPEAGKKLIDCLLSGDVERRMAKSAAHMPLRAGVDAPENVRAVSSLKVMEVDYRAAAQTMERDCDVHLIIDNYATHWTPKILKIQRWLKRHKRFHFHFVPTYSSRLKHVER